MFSARERREASGSPRTRGYTVRIAQGCTRSPYSPQVSSVTPQEAPSCRRTTTEKYPYVVKYSYCCSININSTYCCCCLVGQWQQHPKPCISIDYARARSTAAVGSNGSADRYSYYDSAVHGVYPGLSYRMRACCSASSAAPSSCSLPVLYRGHLTKFPIPDWAGYTPRPRRRQRQHPTEQATAGGEGRGGPTFLASTVRPSSSEDAMIQPARAGDGAPLLPLLTIWGGFLSVRTPYLLKKDTDTDAPGLGPLPIHAPQPANA